MKLERYVLDMNQRHYSIKDIFKGVKETLTALVSSINTQSQKFEERFEKMVETIDKNRVILGTPPIINPHTVVVDSEKRYNHIRS